MPTWTSLKSEQDDRQALIEIVSATLLSSADFWQRAALGQSLRRMVTDARITARIVAGNDVGLPTIYNRRIEAADAHEIIVFMHDDVWIDDYFLADRLLDGLARFDVVGVAGNRRCLPKQPAWLFHEVVNGEFQLDKHNLSGYVGHGKNPYQQAIVNYGAVPAECELLDGLFMASRPALLRQHGVRFDPRFDFHLYDLDFCRSARTAGLRLGTWPIGMTHQSAGSFGTPAWDKNYHLYLEKWRETAPTGAWGTP